MTYLDEGPHSEGIALGEKLNGIAEALFSWMVIIPTLAATIGLAWVIRWVEDNVHPMLEEYLCGPDEVWTWIDTIWVSVFILVLAIGGWMA